MGERVCERLVRVTVATGSFHNAPAAPGGAGQPRSGFLIKGSRQVYDDSTVVWDVVLDDCNPPVVVYALDHEAITLNSREHIAKALKEISDFHKVPTHSKDPLHVPEPPGPLRVFTRPFSTPQRALPSAPVAVTHTVAPLAHRPVHDAVALAWSPTPEVCADVCYQATAEKLQIRRIIPTPHAIDPPVKTPTFHAYVTMLDDHFYATGLWASMPYVTIEHMKAILCQWELYITVAHACGSVFISRLNTEVAFNDRCIFASVRYTQPVT